MRFTGGTRFRAAALIGAAALTLATVFTTGSANAAPGGRFGNIVYQPGPLTAHRVTGIPANKLASPSGWKACLSRIGLACYDVSDIRTAYDLPAGYTGAGQSIAIIDAYGSPTVQSDLDAFSTAMGLPTTTVHVYCPTGCPRSLAPHNYGAAGWAFETSLDVQWAHAIAPDATINLIVASNNYGNVLNNAVRYAITHNLGDVISMSYSAPEAAIPAMGNNVQLLQSEKLFKMAAAKGISVFASSGDDGTDGGAGYPSSSPEVTAVGGTNLYLNGNNSSYRGETVWGDAANCPFTCSIDPVGATGGAPSKIFSAPAYQQGVTGHSMRTTSDVSYDGSLYTGVLTYIGFLGADSGFYIVGGTSAGSPQWAAIAALMDQAVGHRLGQLNPALYQLYNNSRLYGYALHDVTRGNNTWNDWAGFSGGTGYDLPTGIGTPDVSHLIRVFAAG